MAGDVSLIFGVFVAAILARPNVSLPSKYALVMTEAITCKDIIKAWAEATGKDTTYIQVSLQALDSLWPKFRGEMAAPLHRGETVGHWSTLEKGLLSAKGREIDEIELVGMESYLEGAKEQLI